MRRSPIVPAATTSGGPSDGTNPNLRPYGRTQALRHEGRFEEIMATAVLLNAEINEKQARSIKYQLTNAELPLAVGQRQQWWISRST